MPVLAQCVCSHERGLLGESAHAVIAAKKPHHRPPEPQILAAPGREA